jgi:hypothetical protein
MITGDEHRLWACPDFLHATYLGRKSMARMLQPRYVVRHDYGDGYSPNPHHLTNVLAQIMKARTSYGDAELELETDAQHLVKTSVVADATNVIIASNHNEFWFRWLNTRERPGDRNDLLWLEMNAMLQRSAVIGAHGIGGMTHEDPYTLWMQRRCTELGVGIRFLRRNESFVVGPKNVELTYHSDKGVNGSRGSAKQFSRIGPRTVVGHGHGPGREKGCTQVGTGALPGEYELGPGNHAAANAIVHANGYVQLIFIMGNRWRR